MGNYLKIKIYAYLRPTYMDKDASENMEIIMHKNNQKKLKKKSDVCRRICISHTRVSRP